jgi:hypothetical protein
MAVPGDSGAVLKALRLGWYVAEVRGRNRPGPQPGAVVTLPARAEHALPLHTERTATELRIEDQSVLISLAPGLEVDENPADKSSFARTVDAQAKVLQAARNAGAGADALWDSFEDLIYKWDAHIQDTLAQQSDTVACGYQLGRALAECYWVLDPRPADNPPNAAAGAGGGAGQAGGAAGQAGGPADQAGGGADQAGGGVPAKAVGMPARLRVLVTRPIPQVAPGRFPAPQRLPSLGQVLGAVAGVAGAGPAPGAAGPASPDDRPAANPDGPPNWCAWSFLLGRERCNEIERLLGRLTAYFHPYTAAAIAGSVKVWEGVAESEDWRRGASSALYLQIRAWYELILLKQDPTTLLEPFQLLRHYRLLLRAVRMFWAQLAAAALGAVLLALFAWVLTQSHGPTWLATLLGFLGITGVTASGLATKLKNDAEATLKRVKQDAYTDLIAVAITTAPPPPDKSAPTPPALAPAAGTPAAAAPAAGPPHALAAPAPATPAPARPAPAAPAPPAQEPPGSRPSARLTRKQQKKVMKLIQKRTITPITPL